MVSTLFGEASAKHPQLHICGLRAFHTYGALFRGKITGWPLDIEDESTLGKQSCDLAGLDAPYLLLVDRDAEGRNLAVRAQLGEVINLAIDYSPTYSIRDRRARDL